MSKVTVCVRFRPSNSREKAERGESPSIQEIDQETFIFKDDKDGELMFSFDRVFYQGSTQADVFDFVAMPAVRDAVSGINGTIITYGQTGAGKTYSMEGPGIYACAEEQKGLLVRVIEGLFQFIESAGGESEYIVKLSMVEIYMEKVRDLFDLSKGSIQVKESKSRGIFLSGATEVCISDTKQALKHLCGGIANRAVGETQMNLVSSRSHCLYIISIQQGTPQNTRVETGKLILVDLAGSEKVEKTGAEGKVLEEAKTINKSLSALGNVVKALSSGSKVNHVPYRDSKLTRILQDALDGNSRIALLCCCSPSSSDASESLSTLRFGARTKQIRIVSKVSYSKERKDPENVEKVILKQEGDCPCKSGSMNRIIKKLQQYLKEEHVNLLEEMLIMEGIIFDPSNSTEDLESVSEETDGQTISVLSNEVELLLNRVEKLTRENAILKAAAASHREFSIQSALHLLWAVIGDGWKTALLPFQWISVCTWALIRDSWTAATLPVWWARWAADSLFGRAMPEKRF
ncbi:kinesin-like protein KIN-1 [Nymphaea colorata]|nr:kinesin-like protein KIN-1 [Nymphaea colorata]